MQESQQRKQLKEGHGIFNHPNKPKKIRVVFDCSAEFNGVSRNRSLMSGPDSWGYNQIQRRISIYYG